MKSFVVDASVGIKWVVNESESSHARKLSTSNLIAPDLFYPECGNILWKKVRRGDLSQPEATERLSALLTVPIEVVSHQNLMDRSIELAFELDHPVYDCLYLSLAIHRSIQMVTADERLVAVLNKSPRLRNTILPLKDFQPTT